MVSSFRGEVLKCSDLCARGGVELCARGGVESNAHKYYLVTSLFDLVVLSFPLSPIGCSVTVRSVQLDCL
jgi:hypothetical protein